MGELRCRLCGIHIEAMLDPAPERRSYLGDYIFCWFVFDYFR
jgi:hypothetical protein